MKRRRIIVISVGLFFLATVVVLAWPAKEAEPVVKGQPFLIWLRAVSKTPASGAIRQSRAQPHTQGAPLELEVAGA